MLAWVLVAVMLEKFPERYITPAVVGVTLLGWGVTLVWEAPFCIAQGMVSLPYLYIGYLAKKRRLFETPLSGRAKAGLIASALGVVAGVLLTQSTDCVSLGEWTMGPVSIFLDGAVGYGIIRLFLMPLVVLVGCRAAHVGQLATGVAVVLAGMPMGGTTTILAEKYGADSTFASKCTAISTVLSLITTPLWCLVV